jgi:hypothetical protein
MFDNLVDVTEPIYQAIDPNLASMTIFDTSGIEAFVTFTNSTWSLTVLVFLEIFLSTTKNSLILTQKSYR